MTSPVGTYRGALEAVDRIVNRESEADEVLRTVVGILHDRFDRYSWVGIYLVEGGDLVLGPWQGPEETEHIRIPVGQGICGAAAASGRTEIVDDVSSDDRYLPCFPSTRSEIVVPISYEGRRPTRVPRVRAGSARARTGTRPAGREAAAPAEAGRRRRRCHRLRQRPGGRLPSARRGRRRSRFAEAARAWVPSRRPYAAPPHGRAVRSLKAPAPPRRGTDSSAAPFWRAVGAGFASARPS
jgi:putative methionine-R-sulfoxide reductase with GAF domain